MLASARLAHTPRKFHGASSTIQCSGKILKLATRCDSSGQAGTPEHPVTDLQPGPMIGELQWLPFDAAFQQLESEGDREALVRLQLGLQ